MTSNLKRLMPFVLVMAFVLAACGDDGGGTASTTQGTAATTTTRERRTTTTEEEQTDETTTRARRTTTTRPDMRPRRTAAPRATAARAPRTTVAMTEGTVIEGPDTIGPYTRVDLEGVDLEAVLSELDISTGLIGFYGSGPDLPEFVLIVFEEEPGKDPIDAFVLLLDAVASGGGIDSESVEESEIGDLTFICGDGTDGEGDDFSFCETEFEEVVLFAVSIPGTGNDIEATQEFALTVLTA